MSVSLPFIFVSYLKFRERENLSRQSQNWKCQGAQLILFEEPDMIAGPATEAFLFMTIALTYPYPSNTGVSKELSFGTRDVVKHIASTLFVEYWTISLSTWLDCLQAEGITRECKLKVKNSTRLDKIDQLLRVLGKNRSFSQEWGWGAGLPAWNWICGLSTFRCWWSNLTEKFSSCCF